MRNGLGIFSFITLSMILPGQLALAESSSSATVTATVLGTAVGISTGLTPINLPGIDLFDAVLTSGSSSFVVKANSGKTAYDVWISVSQNNLNANADVYVALDSASNALPLTVALAGNTGDNAVNANPAAIQTGARSTARPNTGKKSDGDGVLGTTLSGTTYTVTMTEDNAHNDIYSEIPAGTYSMVITANVATN